MVTKSILLPIYFLLFLISIRKPLWGIVLLSFFYCTTSLFHNIITVEVGSGGAIYAADFVIFGLFLNTVARHSTDKEIDFDFILLLGLFMWLVLCGVLCLAFEQINLRLFYRLVMRIAILWILPITVRDLGSISQRKLINIMLFMVLSVVCVQAYAIVSRDVSFLLKAYYQFDAYDDSQAALVARDNLELYDLPRLMPTGGLFCQMTVPFLTALLFLEEKQKLHILLFRYTLLLGLIIFTVSLGGRVSLIAMFLSLGFIIYYAYKYKLKNNILRYAAGLALILLIGGVYLIHKTSSLPLYEKFMQSYKTGSFETVRPRVTDNLDALNAFIESPVWGIGKTKLGHPSKEGSGNDVHALISLGLYGGLVAIMTVLFWLGTLFYRFKRALRASTKNQSLVLASGGAILLGFVLTMLNTTRIFEYGMTQVPLGIFSGILLMNTTKLFWKQKI